MTEEQRTTLQQKIWFLLGLCMETERLERKAPSGDKRVSRNLGDIIDLIQQIDDFFQTIPSNHHTHTRIDLKGLEEKHHGRDNHED